ncbi:hypothetical protein OJAV_G00041030 [Oryzias javanicus]|uniref:Uncharacterized protein n=1 Tax=Oryzias javanicus TaxID=123683 RepID=A0A437DCS4_ORYJA|nr:hypothetical protein OJAV_G00041030 [Oryzias javanicus]
MLLRCIRYITLLSEGSSFSKGRSFIRKHHDRKQHLQQRPPLANCTFASLPENAQVVFYALCVALGISLILNVIITFVCVSGKRKHQLKYREWRTLQEMEDNPIYGNIDQMETSEALCTEDEPIHVSLSSTSSMNPQEVRSYSQDCYANLHLKAKKRSKCSPSWNQGPSAVPLEGPEPNREGNGGCVGANAVSSVSDLYASVHNQRGHKAFNAVGDEFDH